MGLDNLNRFLYTILTMNDLDLLFEAGAYYCFPPSWKPDAPCPNCLVEYHYREFHNGKEYPIGRVFVLGRTKENFLRLLNSWNTKGLSSGYVYVEA